MTTPTPSYGDLDIKEYVRRTREESGVPARVQDAYVIERVAAMFANAKKPAAGTTGLNALPKEQS